MIGKPEWFNYRIFGWGLAPKTWQGWTYAAAIAIVLGFTTAITINNAVKPIVLGVVFAIIIMDVIHVMTQMAKKHDERENLHQLIIERNCSFAAVATLAGIAIWQSYQNSMLLTSNSLTNIPFDIPIAIVLGVMLLTKVASTAYVKAKM